MTDDKEQNEHPDVNNPTENSPGIHQDETKHRE